MIDRPATGRLPFAFRARAGVGQLVLEAAVAGPLAVDRLILDVTELGTEPGNVPAERFQRRRTRLHALALRLPAAELDHRIEAVRRLLSGVGITAVRGRTCEGYISMRARAADGLAAADVTFRIQLVHAGAHVRALASDIRVHGHLPTPGPVIADRVLVALLGATEAAGVVERPCVRGLCDVEIDLVGATLWKLMPPAGWRLPAAGDVELVQLRVNRAAIEASYEPAGSRSDSLGIRQVPLQLAAAHDLMHSADHELRAGHVEEAMRGYRALLAAGGPEQPILLERILALAAARPTWFFDGLELARQALGRWPQFAAAHGALASITLAQGDAREAAAHLGQLAQLASAEGDDDQASLAALAAARLLRVLEPRAATKLYELAVEHDPSSAEAADALADRLVDEQRWAELVRLLRARLAAAQADPPRAVQLHLRLADVFAHHLGDLAGARAELAAARALAPDEPAVHEMTASVMASSDPAAAVEAWREVARLAESHGDSRTAARAYATVGGLATDQAAEQAWHRALELDPLQGDAIVGLAGAAATRGDHAAAAERYEQLRWLGLPQHQAARSELALARSLVQLGRNEDARGALRRATVAGGETSAEAHAVLAELAEATSDREHAAAELDTAISSLANLASDGGEDRLFARAAELAVARATLLDRAGQSAQADSDWTRAHDLAHGHAPAIARDAARTMLSRAHDGIAERRWIDAVLATRPPAAERAQLLVTRADVRRREATPDLAAALADLHEALALTENDSPDQASLRRRAYQLEAELLAKSGDQRARAQALAALAKLAERSADRVETEAAAAAAWLAADEPASALPHGARAHAELVPDVPAALRREVLTTLGEAAWRQRAWPDVIRAYRGMIGDTGVDPSRVGTYRYRLAVAADRTGDAALAKETLAPLANDPDAGRGTTPEIRGQALRLFAELCERAGELIPAAHALEGFANLGTAGASDTTTGAPPSARADAMYRAGELFRRADRADDAVRCLEAALRISDTHVPALDALEQIWRDRGDLERVSVILGRKVAATARQPQRQKPLLSRLGDLQDQLGRPDVALATHQRALEIDATWRPSLRYVATRLQVDGAKVAAAGGFAQLAGELQSDAGVDLAVVTRERLLAAVALAQLVAGLDDAQVEAVRGVAHPALDRAALDLPHGSGSPEADAIAAGLARLRGEPAPRSAATREEDTASGRAKDAPAGALSLRDAANRARAAGKLDDTFAALEAANHVLPGDPNVLRELVDLARELGDHAAAARHLAALAEASPPARKADVLLELADLHYDVLDDLTAARTAMRDAAAAFGASTRRDATLRLLATEAASHLAWEVAADAFQSIATERRTTADLVQLASALVRGGKTADAIRLVETATATGRLDDGGELLAELRGELARKVELARAYEGRAHTATPAEAAALRADAAALWRAIGGSDSLPDTRPTEPMTAQEMPFIEEPSVRITGTAGENSRAVAAAAASADRERLLAAQREAPDDPALLAALLFHLGEREPELRRAVLEQVAAGTSVRARAIALHELALLARSSHDPIRASALWTRAHRVDPSYAPVWMPLADALAGADEIELARELYAQIAKSDEYEPERRAWAEERADSLGVDDSVVSGEIRPRVLEAAAAASEREPDPDLVRARELAEQGSWQAAAEAAQRAADARPDDTEALELLEQLFLELGDITAASEAIGRQLVLADDPATRALLWRRRAKVYRDALGRDAEAYRCLKEAHACAPEDPEIAYQLRTAAMIRNEWALVASLLYREIGAAETPRDRGALHLELALVYQERLADPAQAQVNFEQALALDPTIPACKAPLAKRYEEIGRHGEAAKLYDEAAAAARAGDRAALLAAGARCRAAAAQASAHPDLSAQLDAADAAGDAEAAVALAHQLWRAEPGHAVAFRVLSGAHRMAGELAALTDLTTVRASRVESADERAEAWIAVARLAEELDRPSDAARAYDLALVERPAHVAALDARASLAFRLSEWATADAIYRDLRTGDSVLGDDELALRRSVISEHLGRDGEALAHAEEAAAAAPGRRDALERVQALATRVGSFTTAIAAARRVIDLLPLEDYAGALAARLALVELYQAIGNIGATIGELEKIVRDHPQHVGALEQLLAAHVDKHDWTTATRYMYQLVPLAATPAARAARLYELGEALLVHLGDVDRADDVFLRASDLDPSHVPTLHRLLDVYWRADDPASIVDVANELATAGKLTAVADGSPLGHALVAAALVGDTELATKVAAALAGGAARAVAGALGELLDRDGKLALAPAATAVAELGRRGVLDLGKLRAAGKPEVAKALS